MTARPAPPRTPCRVTPGQAPAVPVVFDSPHSGYAWPADFVPVAPEPAIRTTWDAHVDALLADAPAAGITLLAATFPRAYVDVNRDAADLDPDLLAAPWPQPLAPTDYSRRGMGLVRRLALPGVPMYDAPLLPDAVEARLAQWYRPYRTLLAGWLADVRAAHGLVWHVDWHSMKSVGNAMNVDAGARRPDIVVSDRRGTTAVPGLVARIVGWFTLRGYVVTANDPYQGGDLVRTFGAPADGCSSVQVELNRALYMDEATCEPHAGFAALRADLAEFAGVIGTWALEAARDGARDAARDAARDSARDAARAGAVPDAR